MKRITLLLVISLLVCFNSINASDSITINIKDQKEFDGIADSIRSHISKGVKSLCIYVNSEKTLFFKERHIYLTGIKAEETSITIKGNMTNISAVGQDFTNKTSGIIPYNEDITPNSCFITQEESRMIPINTGIKQTDELVQVVDPNKKLCRIKSNYYSSSPNMRIQVTASFLSYICPILYIKKGYIYFIDENLEYREQSGGYYSINHDYAFGKSYPRYRLFNIPSNNTIFCKNNYLYLPKDTKHVHECSAKQFIRIVNCAFKELIITGLNFTGSKGPAPLLFIHSTQTKSLEISNCHFKYIKGDILTLFSSTNINFHDNISSDCWRDAIIVYNDCKNINIFNNTFSDMGGMMQQQHVIFCQGENYHIYNNIFKDFSYCAIRVGVHYKTKMSSPCYGVIENNEIFYTKDYFNNARKHTLMDSGAIYVATQNTHTVIKDNYIHDYTGMAENRGIFCDDGAMNVKILRNIVENIPNSYTIDAWRAVTVDKYVPNCNSNNSFSCNLLFGAYRFQGRDGGKCYNTRNLIVNDKKGETVLTNVISISKDIDVTNELGTKPTYNQMVTLIKKYDN